MERGFVRVWAIYYGNETLFYKGALLINFLEKERTMHHKLGEYSTVNNWSFLFYLPYLFIYVVS